MRVLLLPFLVLVLGGCSMFGHSGVEEAPYQVLKTSQDAAIEVRQYNSMILASTPMDADVDDSQRKPFMRLFDYISGDNVERAEIAMTAPVFMGSAQGEGQKIAMTAPVFMGGDDGEQVMSFVLPADFTMETAPVPVNSDVTLTEVQDYKVAAITFSGRLSEDNRAKYLTILQDWIAQNGYEQTGPYQYAGYNPPFTIPVFRRNEVLIPVQ